MVAVSSRRRNKGPLRGCSMESLQRKSWKVSSTKYTHTKILRGRWLKNVAVCLNCDRPKCLLFEGLLGQLQNLEEITVQGCYKMTCIVQEEYITKYWRSRLLWSRQNQLNFPRLRSLKLGHLPNLKSIYDGVIVCDCLQSVKILSCGALERLPLALSASGNLQLLSPLHAALSSPRLVLGVTI